MTMVSNLYVNDLIEWLDDSGETTVERIVWLDENYILAFLFDINTNKGMPYPKRISEIEDAIAEGYALKLKSDPWLKIVTEDNLSEKEKEIRNRAWDVISELVQQEPDIYERAIRGSLVNKAIADSPEKIIKKTIYGYLRKYWQRGKTKNALLPDYYNSGGRGKTKNYSSGKKRGRPRKYNKTAKIGKGVNITEEDRRIFRIAIAKFYNNRKKNYLTTAYKLMLKEYYAEETIFDANGVKKSILIPPEKRPTLTQFRYWYNKEHKDIKKTTISRRGSRAFALENRAILGTSKQETIGPGSRYQIDATVTDVYLVSKYNRNWIIGRPVVYVVIDVFSRMITGVYVGLEGPSWLGMMMALVNAATDKVKFCAEYGIEIEEEEWLTHHIPDAILGDRGELAGKNVETSIDNLGIRIENAAPYRADWKGLVERHFRIIHDRVKPFLPGYVDVDFTQRGGKDYRLDAKLDLDQFTRIIIHLIRYHNNEHHLQEYSREEMMIADDVLAIPQELWQWGITNRSGRLRTIPEDIVKLNLMPADKATITPKGIRFKQLYYTCEKATREQWFERARSRSMTREEKLLNISYDPRKPNIIYLRSPDGRDFEKCFLIDPDHKYVDKSIYEIEYLQEYEKQQQQVSQGQQIQKEVDLMAEIENEVKQAQLLTEAVQDQTLSNNQKVKGIRDNRAFEKEKRRQEEAFELGQNESSSPVEPIEELETVKPKTTSSKTKSDRSLKRKNLKLLRKMRLERSVEED